tara:strand:+ start:126 stop:656 length:531 start_codon:yes stop_codon:yes gene_type:complete
MKFFKTKLYLIAIFATILSCVNEERSVGMSSWEGVEDMKWHIGTQGAVDLAKAMDEAWKARNYDQMRTYISDTASITSSNGYNWESVDAFIDRWKYNDSVWDSNGTTFKWSFTNLFSVDLDPSTGGEHVHADYFGTFTKDGNVDNFRVMNRYYIIEGKIVMWNSYSQEIVDEESND